MEGKFFGLEEGTDCDILTLKGELVVCLSLGKKNRKAKKKTHYVKWRLIDLKPVLSTFDNWKCVSKPRHLTYSQGKIYVTDRGLHKLLVVDLAAAHQSSAGFLGSGPGQIRRPSGILADEVGNLLVVDQGNSRICVCDSAGNFLKAACDLGLGGGAALRRLVGHIWVACGGEEGAVVAFTLHQP